MKFWLSLAAAIVLVVVLSTSLRELNPENRRAPEVSPEPAPTAEAPIKAPKFVFESQQVIRDNIGQNQAGETLFPFENKGDADLRIAADKPNCVCIGIEIVKGPVDDPIESFKRVPEGDTHPPIWKVVTTPVDGKDSLTFKPGEKGTIISRWNSKNREGSYNVNIPILTDDPRPKYEKIIFQTVLNIRRDIDLSPTSVSFGKVIAGQPVVRNIKVFSNILDDLKIEDIKTSSPYVTVTQEPLTKDELDELHGKSGQLLQIKLLGELPVGTFSESLELRTNSSHQPMLSFPAVGEVEGPIEITPKEADFKSFPYTKEETKRIKIFAKGFSGADALQIGTTEPSFVKAELSQDPKLKKVWDLLVTVPVGAPIGKFSGNISLVDKEGNKKLNVRVAGSAFDPLDKIEASK